MQGLFTSSGMIASCQVAANAGGAFSRCLMPPTKCAANCINCAALLVVMCPGHELPAGGAPGLHSHFLQPGQCHRN